MEEDPAIQIFGSEDFDLYNTLELEKDASQNEIKKAYRRLALRFHPDKQASETKETSREDAVTKFQQVGYAYAVLSDDKRKEKYDKTGNTTEGVGFGPGESGSWDAYFKELWSGEVSAATIDEFFNTYEGKLSRASEITLLTLCMQKALQKKRKSSMQHTMIRRGISSTYYLTSCLAMQQQQKTDSPV